MNAPISISKQAEELSLGKGHEEMATYLIKANKLKQSDWLRAKNLSGQSLNEPLPALLIKLGLVSEKDLAEAIAHVSGLPLVGSDAYPLTSVLPHFISSRFLKEFHLVGLTKSDETTTLAVADPFDQSTIKSIRLICDQGVNLCIGVISEIDRAIDVQMGLDQESRSGLSAVIDHDTEVHQADVEHLKDLASEAPIIRMVSSLIQKAVDMRASDIHIEPFEQRLKVRYRVDGVLREVDAPPAKSTAAVISRIKIMAKLDIAERRLPQDGRITLQAQGRELDLRVSSTPTMYGESVVIRLLDKKTIHFDFESLGFDGDELRRFLDVIKIPHGIVLITGPTGSGKSTTLYTALNKINTVDRKIITVEDPVEYQLEGINQIQVKPQIGLTFANTLKSIMRQDPDVIMIGEMRDLETGRIAVQAALTGHLVFSTLHTNTAASGITRLLDMGLEDYLITSTVNGILSQRLVRRLCEHCRVPTNLPPGIEAPKDAHLSVVYLAVGCDVCDGSGYRGRLAITEFLVMNDRIRRMIMEHAQSNEIEEVGKSFGMETMYQNGIRKVFEGLTTLEEVLRVTTDA